MLGTHSDFTTFAHESAHYYLSTLTEMSREAGASERIKGDMNTLLKWFGVKNLDAWQQMPISEQAKYHEQFAYTWEKYLSDGKAPTEELQIRELELKLTGPSNTQPKELDAGS